MVLIENRVDFMRIALMIWSKESEKRVVIILKRCENKK